MNESSPCEKLGPLCLTGHGHLPNHEFSANICKYQLVLTGGVSRIYLNEIDRLSFLKIGGNGRLSFPFGGKRLMFRGELLVLRRVSEYLFFEGQTPIAFQCFRHLESSLTHKLILADFGRRSSV